MGSPRPGAGKDSVASGKRRSRFAFVSNTHTASSSLASAIIAITLLLCATTTTSQGSVSCVNELTICDGEGEAYRPYPGCKEYAQCLDGKVTNTLSCSSDSIFDVLLKRCHWEYASFCIAKSCAPTPPPSISPTDFPSGSPSASPTGSPSGSPSASPSESPTASPTGDPSAAPSASPSESPTASPSGFPSASPTNAPTFDFFEGLQNQEMKRKMESTVLLSKNPAGIAYPSTKYSYVGLIEALKEMVAGISSDGRTFRFFAHDEQRIDYGRTNLAAFLAMAMTETITYDTCDEFNVDEVADRYALSNACGQNSRSYQDEICKRSDEQKMNCPVDRNMEIVSSGYSTGMIGRAPPPFSCKPQSDSNDYAGYWDARTGASSNTAYSNAIGRSDLEGCCWWGRGALLTRGVCNIGKLDYYLGKRAYVERGEGKFHNIDFCANPEATCASEEGTEEMRWITGLFEWIERIQSYPDWDYVQGLEQFVDGGMKDDSFIDTVSSIFTRGCHSSECSNLEVTMLEERRVNFKKVLDIFELPSFTAPPTPSRPRPLATPEPTTQKPVTFPPVKNILPPSFSLNQPTPPQPPPNNQNQNNNPVVWPGPTSDDENTVNAPVNQSPQSQPPPNNQGQNTNQGIQAPPTQENENTANAATNQAPQSQPPPNNQGQNTNQGIQAQPTQENENTVNIPTNQFQPAPTNPVSGIKPENTPSNEIDIEFSDETDNELVKVEDNSSSRLTIFGCMISFALSVYVLNVY